MFGMFTHSFNSSGPKTSSYDQDDSAPTEARTPGKKRSPKQRVGDILKRTDTFRRRAFMNNRKWSGISPANSKDSHEANGGSHLPELLSPTRQSTKKLHPVSSPAAMEKAMAETTPCSSTSMRSRSNSWTSVKKDFRMSMPTPQLFSEEYEDGDTTESYYMDLPMDTFLGQLITNIGGIEGISIVVPDFVRPGETIMLVVPDKQTRLRREAERQLEKEKQEEQKEQRQRLKQDERQYSRRLFRSRSFDNASDITMPDLDDLV